ncbi:flavin-containing monooxygenase FMO GS-OX-like 4 [Bufo gargarizans]|uniref:flavin-containing monooxygenase FMO GS-OX-like 4 n=1 Tax=Bufo gargarizans TaxID=30331 RepID=UPI001CF3EE55|nr:flavin-containing monooxygenase FMO GS-OX-like 4 [Bufo gargarizans]
MASSRLRVAVIGAGAAGLCSARQILSRSLIFEPPVVFEMTDHVGGTWVYVEEPGNIDSTHSSMYRDLKTNLPKEIMEFPDFAFDPYLPSFIHHSEVLKYLEEYTDKFSIRPHIKFNTRVVSIYPVLGGQERVSWKVVSSTRGEEVLEKFDAVMVCVGHYSRPYIPDIDGIKDFQGQVLHSHFYRYPEVFSSRSIVVLGSGPSGVDIAIELSTHAKWVTLSHRGPPLNWTPPENVSMAPPVVSATQNALVCEDGSKIQADTLIFCTGYTYHYPFLLPSEGEMAEHENVLDWGFLDGEDMESIDLGTGHLPPLYKHLIHARYPTLCFIGACKIVVPFPLVDCQAQFFLLVLEGKCPLPPPEQMLSESRTEFREHRNSGLPLKYLHRLGPRQWEYNRWLADTAGFEPLAPVLEKLYEAVREFRGVNPVTYRKRNFKILSREEFEMQTEVTQEADV